ncbi:hypothetical protein K402DRAFT_422972 [Aulographum hederae CBS 113979]|uniref:Ricin B lectin domain-containing protein n=1 Tax=Aulographum hederae CBS 113979 TaxID=1176131 RepID=A0A6G1GUN9_9PEZI|nr:hypothetical protein K402DRAFT_422972 [Aulographum hederae CBS 113979]
MADLNPNVWYQIIENRTTFEKSSLQAAGTGVFFAAPGPDKGQYWQIQQASPPSSRQKRYQLRNKWAGIKKQLAVCHNANELDPSRTQPCFLPTTGNNEQLWTIDPWDDDIGSHKIQNAANGTRYYMDSHPGNPLFMASETGYDHVAQRWLFKSIGLVNDGEFSATIMASTSTSSSSTPQPTAQNTSNSGKCSSKSCKKALSPGAAAGIGVGVAVMVIISILVMFVLIRRKRQRKQRDSVGKAELDGSSEVKGLDIAYTAHEKRRESVHEAPIDAGRFEMESSPMLAELPGSGANNGGMHGVNSRLGS